MLEHACAIITEGHHTDIVIKLYSNRIFLIVTHFKKIGSLVTVNRESILDQPSSNIFFVKTVFGKDDVDIHAAARYLAEQINIDRPLLLSICLKSYSVETVQDIVKAINQVKLW